MEDCDARLVVAAEVTAGIGKDGDGGMLASPRWCPARIGAGGGIIVSRLSIMIAAGGVLGGAVEANLMGG